MSPRMLLAVLLGVLALSSHATAAEVLLPQTRVSYYASEPFELAVVGLAKGAKAAVELVPLKAEGLSPMKFEVTGDGGTVNTRIPPLALAPAVYVVRLDGKDTPVKLAIAAGVADSTMLVTQVDGVERLAKGAANFILGNAFPDAVLTPEGLPSREPRRATGLVQSYDKAIAAGYQTIIYMYWTGYVTHKPFGTRKSWAAPEEQEAMRLLSFGMGQRLRRFAPNILAVGTIDEPGLSWGKTPAGGYATGFPNWDEAAWYEARGWKFTDNPASRGDADWMKYMTVRSGIIGESQAQAKKDLRASWPEARFEADCYAVAVIMDGADAMNQLPNEAPTTHVFLDWGVGRDCTGTELYIEKSSMPTGNVAHAMNGRLMGDKMPPEVQADCYRLMMNAMLQAGLRSNWWLNWGEVPLERLAGINEPPKRYGPLLSGMTTAGHDVAVLWGWTELAMRMKDITAKEAAKKEGEQIKLMISAMPENTTVREKEVALSAYTVGGMYRQQISYTHNALARAGYPAHVIHERILPTGILKNYKTLFIVGQTFPLPPETAKALAGFVAKGGRIIADKTTTVKIDGATAMDVDLAKPARAWGALFKMSEEDAKGPKNFKTAREASYYQTNVFMDKPIKDAVPAFRAILKGRPSPQAVETDTPDLLIDRHVGGDGQVIMVLNSHQELPNIADSDRYSVWNYAPFKARFSLPGVKKASAVYAVEGVDWKKTGKVDAAAPIEGDFAPGEMKLYVVAPREPKGLAARAAIKDRRLAVGAELKGLKMPWPIEITVIGPDGKDLYHVWRATDARGEYAETFPVGGTAAPGDYVVKVASPLADLAVQAKAAFKASVPAPAPLSETVRVFDARAIADFLAAKPEVIIAIGSNDFRAAAESLAKALGGKGVKARVADEKQVFKRVRYPRVWDPECYLWKPEGAEKPPDGPVAVRLTLELAEDGRTAAKAEDGKDLGREWRKPRTLVTIGPLGYTDYSGDTENCYEGGCVLYMDERNQLRVLKGTRREVKTTPEFRARWSRPWHHLSVHYGGYQLVPELTEGYSSPDHLILLGDSKRSELVAAIQAGGLLLQVADEKYPGPGKALLAFVWSPFAVEKNAIFIGATDEAGLSAGVARLLKMK